MTTGRDVVFVQVEVGAISSASDLARAVGISDNDCLGGLVRFWHHAIRDNRRIKENSHIDTETLQAVTLQCWGRDVPAKHLEIAGFLAKDETGGWRVRGMSRYIESEEKREKMRALASRGGQASAQAKSKRTLKRTLKRTVEHSSSVPPSDSQAYRQAIGNQDGRRETGDEIRDIEKKHASRPRDELADALCASFLSETQKAYKPSKADWIQLSSLKATETPSEIAVRWTRGLRNAKSGAFPGVSTFAQLASKWNDLAIERRPLGSKQAQPEPDYFQGTGEITAEDIPF